MSFQWIPFQDPKNFKITELFRWYHPNGGFILTVICSLYVPSCKLTVRHGKSTILMVFTRKDGDFHGQAVSFREGKAYVREFPHPKNSRLEGSGFLHFRYLKFLVIKFLKFSCPKHQVIDWQPLGPLLKVKLLVGYM